MKNENLLNLTALWREASRPFQYKADEFFKRSFVTESQWPNRLWFNEEPSESEFNKLKQIPNLNDMIIPYWGDKKETVDHNFKNIGFECLFSQVGMSLELDKICNTEGNLQIRDAKSAKEMVSWSNIFKTSFNYYINPKILETTCSNINYLIAYVNNKPVGTAMTNRTDNTVGIHGVGVPPEQRRKGYAEQIMKNLINQSIHSSATELTLQASVMGKGLYLKLGFTEDFKIYNYISKEHSLYKQKKV